MKSKIKELLISSGADDCGVCESRVFSELAPALGGDRPPFSEKIDINPFAVMPNARSIIVFVVSYKSEKHGNISSYAFGQDYHDVLLRIASPVVLFLQSQGFSAMAFSDTGVLPERHLAYLAGLGFLGKNHCLIHPTLGSFIFIGYILTDCPISPDKPIDAACSGCLKCLNACPSGALCENNFHLCISYITQKKGTHTNEEAELLKSTGMVWGCDICQRVCPHNAAAPDARHPDFCEGLLTDFTADEGISNRDFRRLYSHRAFSWRGKSVLLRNLKETQ